jgi:hypothetical protein
MEKVPLDFALLVAFGVLMFIGFEFAGRGY